MSAELLLVTTTVATREQAQHLATGLVERRLAACAQIAEINSVYWWDGTVQNEREFRVTLKVVASGYEAAEQTIRELHPYELPEIVAVKPERVYAPYGEWVAAQSGLSEGGA